MERCGGGSTTSEKGKGSVRLVQPPQQRKNHHNAYDDEVKRFFIFLEWTQNYDIDKLVVDYFKMGIVDILQVTPTTI